MRAWRVVVTVGMVEIASGLSVFSGCGARTTLDDRVDASACAAIDPDPRDDAAIVVPPVAFVPRSATLAWWSSSVRVVLISSSPDACNEFVAFSHDPAEKAPADARWLELEVSTAAKQYELPADNTAAAVARYCAGDDFGYLAWVNGWTTPGARAVAAEGGVIDVANYVEGDYASGSYDLSFAGGSHVRGTFDAGWCEASAP